MDGRREYNEFLSQKKIKLVNGSIPVPREDDLNFVAWEICSNLVHSWLINFMKSHIVESVIYIEHVVNVWNDLKEKYLQEDKVDVVALY